MYKILTIISIAALVTACGVDPRKATTALEAQGMTNVKIGGFAWTGCGSEDSFSSHFSAIGVNGKPVTGVVCSDFFKGTTIRYD